MFLRFVALPVEWKRRLAPEAMDDDARWRLLAPLLTEFSHFGEQCSREQTVTSSHGVHAGTETAYGL